MKLQQLEVKPEVVKALTECGYNEPTDIQQKAIPLIMAGKDVIGKSKTGSGKTAAFGIPLVDQIIPRAGVQALVLAPTRELAVQISGELEKFGKYTDVKITTVYGGVALDPQTRAIARSDIIVGTPGRVLDHLNRRNLNLSKLTHFVLDEADRMVDMGFIHDIERILSHTPKRKQMLLFGATISQEVERLEQNHMNHPVIAEAECQVDDEYLEQYYYNVLQQEKFSLLVHLINTEEMDQTIIFCSTRNTVELVSKNLRAQGIESGMLHGKLTQNKRLRIIGEFNKGRPKILVASPVAARGLDIKDVSHILNYDLSQDPQEYVHRVGRTARAGESGKAITLLGPRDHDAFGQIINNYDLNIQELPKDKFPRLRFDTTRVSQSNGRFGGNRLGRDSRNQSGGHRGRGNWDPRTRSERSDRPRNGDRESRFDNRRSNEDGPRAPRRNGSRSYSDRPSRPRSYGSRPSDDKPRSPRGYDRESRSSDDRPRAPRSYGTQSGNNKPRSPRGNGPRFETSKSKTPRGSRSKSEDNKPRASRNPSRSRTPRSGGPKSFGSQPRRSKVRHPNRRVINIAPAS